MSAQQARCDRCGAGAVAQARSARDGGQQLFLCGDHWDAHHEALRLAGWWVIRGRGVLCDGRVW